MDYTVREITVARYGAKVLAAIEEICLRLGISEEAVAALLDSIVSPAASSAFTGSIAAPQLDSSDDTDADRDAFAMLVAQMAYGQETPGPDAVSLARRISMELYTASL